MPNPHTKIQHSIIAQAWELGGTPLGGLDTGVPKSFYTIRIRNELNKRFNDVLRSIRPGESKVWYITPTMLDTEYNIKVTEEELILIKLSVDCQSITSNDRE